MFYFTQKGRFLKSVSPFACLITVSYDSTALETEISKRKMFQPEINLGAACADVAALSMFTTAAAKH